MIDPKSGFITEVENIDENYSVMKMIDPKTGFMIEGQTADGTSSDCGILNCYTGELSFPETFPCIDLVDSSDEENPMTVEGTSKGKKRVWRKTDKQDWLKIYQEYMEKRSKQQPKTLDFRDYRDKHITVGRNGFRSAGKPRRNLKQDSPKNDRIKNTETDKLKRTKTVKDLKRFSERHKVERDLQEMSESDSGDRNLERLSKETKQGIDVDNMEQMRIEEEEIEDFAQDLDIRKMAEGLVKSCDKSVKSGRDMHEVSDSDTTGLERCLSERTRQRINSDNLEQIINKVDLTQDLKVRKIAEGLVRSSVRTEKNGIHIQEVSVSDNTTDIERFLSERINQNLDSDSDQISHEADFTQEIRIREMAKYLVKSCDRTEKSGRDLLEVSDSDTMGLQRCPAEQTKQCLDSDDIEEIKIELELMQDPEVKSIAEHLVKSCDRTENSLDEDLWVLDVDPNHKAEDSDEIEEYNDIEYLDEGLSGHDKKKINFNKVKSRNLRYNSLKLLKYSNICLFKWTKYHFVCYECQHRSNDMQSLRTHVEDNHMYRQIARKILKEKHTFHKVDITDLECRICCVLLNGLNELEQHLIEHDVRLKKGGTTLIPYKLCTDILVCQLCDDVFASRYRLQKHMNEHFLNFICPRCKVGFANCQSLKKHSHRCQKRSFGATKYLKCRPRLKNSPASDEARFKCSQCPLAFRYDYKRLQHLIEKHDKESKLFQCEFCPKIFMTVHWLTKHMNCVHRDELYS